MVNHGVLPDDALYYRNVIEQVLKKLPEDHHKRKELEGDLDYWRFVSGT